MHFETFFSFVTKHIWLLANEMCYRNKVWSDAWLPTGQFPLITQTVKSFIRKLGKPTFTEEKITDISKLYAFFQNRFDTESADCYSGLLSINLQDF